MRPTGAVDAKPLSDDARAVLLGLEAMTVDALLFQGRIQSPNDTLDHAALLRAVRRDERQLEAMTTQKARIGQRGEHQPER